MSEPARFVPSEAALVARCRLGDEAAWRALVERYAPYVHAVCVRAFGLAPADAEEVFQEAFARAYTRLDELRRDDALRPWLAQITRRLAVDRLRSAAREAPLGQVGPPPRPVEDELARLEEAVVVREALERLPAPCREILERFYARDESYAAIAAALGVAPGTVASRLSRCLERLRDELEGREHPREPS